MGRTRRWISALTPPVPPTRRLPPRRPTSAVAHLHLALDAALLGTWDWDLTTDSIVWCGNHEQMMGLAPNSFDGRYDSFARAVHPDDLPGVEAAVALARDTRTTYEHEFRVCWPDGSIHWLAGRGRFFYAGGRPVRMTGVIQDISEPRRRGEELARLTVDLERRVAERTAELAARNRELERFSFTVSHDLKAPLRGIDGYCRLLEADYAPQLDGDGRQFLAAIRTATSQMTTLIDDLLAYSRLERRAPQHRPVELLALAQEVVAAFDGELLARGASLTLDLPPAVVVAEPEGLAQALRNLIDNALKFTRDVPAPQVQIGGALDGANYLLWVRDNGPGIDPAHHERIFEIFQRLHSPDDYSGSGVGLAIVRKAAERMGGRAWVKSAVGQGATFFLSLPRTPAPAAGAPAP